MIPGEYQIQDGEIELNAGRRTLTLTVANSGDRPIQVGSHYHFFETNDALTFDRASTRGMRLNIPAGTAVRFEPGQSREVELVDLAGARRVFGFAGRVMGDIVDQVQRVSGLVGDISAGAREQDVQVLVGRPGVFATIGRPFHIVETEDWIKESRGRSLGSGDTVCGISCWIHRGKAEFYLHICGNGVKYGTGLGEIGVLKPVAFVQDVHLTKNVGIGNVLGVVLVNDMEYHGNGY